MDFVYNSARGDLRITPWAKPTVVLAEKEEGVCSAYAELYATRETEMVAAALKLDLERANIFGLRGALEVLIVRREYKAIASALEGWTKPVSQDVSMNVADMLSCCEEECVVLWAYAWSLEARRLIVRTAPDVAACFIPYVDFVRGSFPSRAFGLSLREAEERLTLAYVLRGVSKGVVMAQSAETFDLMLDLATRGAPFMQDGMEVLGLSVDMLRAVMCSRCPTSEALGSLNRLITGGVYFEMSADERGYAGSIYSSRQASEREMLRAFFDKPEHITFFIERREGIRECMKSFLSGMTKAEAMRMDDSTIDAISRTLNCMEGLYGSELDELNEQMLEWMGVWRAERMEMYRLAKEEKS